MTMNRFANVPFLPKVAAALLMLACSAAMAQPRFVKDTEVQPCRYLGRVSADSGYGKSMDWRGTAKYAAMRQAEKLGASDVVVDRYTPVGAFNGQVDARAYLCGSPVKSADTNGEASKTNGGVAANGQLAAPETGVKNLYGAVSPVETGLSAE
jgi:hypothetical protein